MGTDIHVPGGAPLDSALDVYSTDDQPIIHEQTAGYNQVVDTSALQSYAIQSDHHVKVPDPTGTTPLHVD